MTRCPHCATQVKLCELPHQGFFKSHRLCPECGGGFTVDRRTKYRQALFIAVLLISAVLSILLYLGDTAWLMPSLLSYLFLALAFYWGNKKLFLVPYTEDQDNTKDS